MLVQMQISKCINIAQMLLGIYEEKDNLKIGKNP